MPIMGTEGDDVIDVEAEHEASGEFDVEALGGDDLIIFEAFPLDPQDFHVDGGAGLDTLEFRISGDETPGATVDARAGHLHGLTFEAVERFRIILGSSDDSIFTLDGNDLLIGGGGEDYMEGGGGDDTYLVQQPGDEINEYENGGIDTVRTTIPLTLDFALENLVLLPGARSGRGNELDNEIIGNSAANELEGFDGDDVLDGAGGADILRGGRGSDTYIVDNASDSVREISGALGGIDTVRSSVSFTLGDFTENLVLLTGATNATGNSLSNDLTGNAAANQLNGRAGADTMRGMGGNDTYIVDNVGDLVLEPSVGGGVDTVRASISYTLGAELENLTLTGTAAINGTGNSRANIIIGNSAANTLAGHSARDTINGGAGDDRIFGGSSFDTLRGDAGTDRFYFDTHINDHNNVDDLVDFTPADDWILLDEDIFDGLPNGLLSASAFRLGTSAQDSSDRIIYDQATGRIFHDPDGAGGSVAVQFAEVPDGTVLTPGDFFVYG